MIAKDFSIEIFPREAFPFGSFPVGSFPLVYDIYGLPVFMPVRLMQEISKNVKSTQGLKLSVGATIDKKNEVEIL